MANSRRVEKLSALLKREISDLLVTGVRDERIHQAMITITTVEVSGDLQHAKIFISLLVKSKRKTKSYLVWRKQKDLFVQSLLEGFK